MSLEELELENAALHDEIEYLSIQVKQLSEECDERCRKHIESNLAIIRQRDLAYERLLTAYNGLAEAYKKTEAGSEVSHSIFQSMVDVEAQNTN